MGNTKDLLRWDHNPFGATPSVKQSARLHVVSGPCDHIMVGTSPLPTQFPHPPNSAAKTPPGFKTFLALRMTPTGSRLHQCRAALLKTLSN